MKTILILFIVGYSIAFFTLCISFSYFRTWPTSGRQQENVVLTTLQRKKILAHSTTKYQTRRNLIQNYCDTHKSDELLNEVNEDRYHFARFPLRGEGPMWFDYENQLLWCIIQKSGSTSWADQFSK